METSSIKSQITKHIRATMKSENPRLHLWYVGITNYERRRMAEHNAEKGLVKYWKCFNAETVDKANEVERYFHTKGTRNSASRGGAIRNSIYVYVFKWPTSKPAGLNGLLSEKNLLDQLFK